VERDRIKVRASQDPLSGDPLSSNLELGRKRDKIQSTSGSGGGSVPKRLLSPTVSFPTSQDGKTGRFQESRGLTT